MLSIADTVLSTKHHAINASVFASSLGVKGDLQFRNVCLFLILVLILFFAVGLEVSACLSSIELFLVAMGDTNPCRQKKKEMLRNPHQNCGFPLALATSPKGSNSY